MGTDELKKLDELAKRLRDETNRHNKLSAQTRIPGHRVYYDKYAALYSQRAADAELKILKALTDQPHPICPVCFHIFTDIDGYDALEQLIQCDCGMPFVAVGKPSVVWTSRTLPNGA